MSFIDRPDADPRGVDGDGASVSRSIRDEGGEGDEGEEEEEEEESRTAFDRDRRRRWLEVRESAPGINCFP
jgi:hypothetical protein